MKTYPAIPGSCGTQEASGEARAYPGSCGTQKTYTIIGLHDNGEIFAEHETAETPSAAILAVSNRKPFADAEILGAIETTAPFVTMSEAFEEAGNLCRS
jgi:hypothetical protein